LDPIKVYSEEGTRVDNTDTRPSPADPKVLIVDLKNLSDGVYGVDWGVTSKDGHVIDGTLGFTVDSASTEKGGAGGPEAEDGGAPSAGISVGWIVAVVVVVVGGVCLVALAALRTRWSATQRGPTVANF
jgi:CopC domain-containing protein